MNTDEIQCILKRAKLGMRFLGVFPADKVPKHGHGDGMSCCVANTDPHDRPGEHWVAFVWKGKELYEYFDPYGMPLETYQTLHETMMLMQQWPRSVSSTAVQPPLSTACGHFCVYFLCFRSRSMSLASIVSRLVRIPIRSRESFVLSFVRDLTSTLRLRRPCRRSVCRGSQCCKVPG